jgi:hypothetical protein
MSSSSKAERDAVEAWTARLVEALFGCTAVRTGKSSPK